ncbi:MAG: tRNA preQ1(34) S-adenosylmethionine ribosyltransferase-isomerase QueA [Pirellulaceae bacterium]
MSRADDYDYELPRELIAQHPLAQRGDARLMVVSRSSGDLRHTHVRELPGLLRPTDTLVLNDTRVIPARLVGTRTKTGGRWFGLFLAADEHGVWQVMCKTRGKAQPGETIILQDREGRDAARLRLLVKLEGGVWAVRPESNEPHLEFLDRVGRVPLPHYIRHGEMVDADLADYQTVYAQRPGAVAAPTAGLHFTPKLLEQIRATGVGVEQVTLHVGVGTFKPIAVESLEEHRMHSEWGRIDRDVAERLNARRGAGGRIVAVGTTAVRVLESAAADDGRLQAWEAETDLFIHPPYRFRAVDALMTNFHLPRSTLLVLVRTFGGDDLIRRAYDEAIREGYRFFSYGDAMLIE